MTFRQIYVTLLSDLILILMKKLSPVLMIRTKFYVARHIVSKNNFAKPGNISSGTKVTGTWKFYWVGVKIKNDEM